MDTSRLEAFSDAVFVIAITLLVLEIKVPYSGVSLGGYLLNLWPSYLAYAISFIVLGAIWINHHAMFQYIERGDQLFLFINIIFLMFVAFLPVPTAVLSQALHDRINVSLVTAFYGGTLAIIGSIVNIKWRYGAYKHRLISDHLPGSEVKRYGHRLLCRSHFLRYRHSDCADSTLAGVSALRWDKYFLSLAQRPAHG